MKKKKPEVRKDSTEMNELEHYLTYEWKLPPDFGKWPEMKRQEWIDKESQRIEEILAI